MLLFFTNLVFFFEIMQKLHTWCRLLHVFQLPRDVRRTAAERPIHLGWNGNNVPGLLDDRYTFPLKKSKNRMWSYQSGGHGSTCIGRVRGQSSDVGCHRRRGVMNSCIRRFAISLQAHRAERWLYFSFRMQ